MVAEGRKYIFLERRKNTKQTFLRRFIIEVLRLKAFSKCFVAPTPLFCNIWWVYAYLKIECTVICVGIL